MNLIFHSTEGIGAGNPEEFNGFFLPFFAWPIADEGRFGHAQIVSGAKFLV